MAEAWTLRMHLRQLIRCSDREDRCRSVRTLTSEDSRRLSLTDVSLLIFTVAERIGVLVEADTDVVNDES